MKKELLSEINLRRGMRIKIWLVVPNDSSEHFVLLEGWGPIHKNVTDWIVLLQKDVMASKAGLVVIIGPKSAQAEKTLGSAIASTVAWIGANKFTFQPKPKHLNPVGIRTIDLISCFEDALIWEDTLELRKAREDAHLKMLAQIRKEEQFLRRYPIVCETKDLFIPYQSGSLSKPSADLFHLSNCNGFFTPSVPAVACLSENLRRGVLINPNAPIAFRIHTKVDPRKLDEEGYWEDENIQVKRDGAKESWHFWARKASPEVVRHPPLNPHDPNPQFIPLWERLKR